MRDFIFLTKRKLFAKDCFEAFNNEIKYVKSNGENHIWIDAKFRSYMEFSDETIDDFIFESEEEKEKIKKKIPIENPSIIHFETHRSVDLKRVITVLMQICPELYIWDDWDNIASAQEYLDTEFDF